MTTNNPRFILVVPGWTDDLSSAVPLTIYEPTQQEADERQGAKAADDAFTAEHLCSRETFSRVAHSQANLCLQCGRSLDPDSQYLSMDNGEGLYCSTCSPFRAFARATQAAREGR